jgi:hypothetical protein
MSKVVMPAGLAHVTVDTVAECLPYEDDDNMTLYKKLWRLLAEASRPTPQGGDGSNGTVETPGDQLDSRNNDTMGHLWGSLTPAEQLNIALAYAKEWGHYA